MPRPIPRRRLSLRAVLRASLALSGAVFVLLLGPRLHTVACPSEPDLLVVARPSTATEAGYCVQRVTRDGLQPWLSATGQTLCGPASAPLQERAEALYATGKVAVDSCRPPPTFTAAWRFWSNLMGVEA